jgi:hypothetical protein
MNDDLRQALEEYILTVRTCGWEAGEEYIKVQNQEFPDFWRWAYALAIVVRVREILMA